jgi:ribosomal protein S18 acetylase RimI-like enzyme
LGGLITYATGGPSGYFYVVDTSSLIQPATLADAAALTSLINQAYRGPATPQAWTTEAHLLDGPRLGEGHVLEMVRLTRDHHAALLKYAAGNGSIQGCVYLEPKGKRLYLSTLAVAPEAQAQGVGRQLLAAAEDYARQLGCTHVLLSVLAARPELLAWYERHGYQRTGESEAFPDTTEFGRPRQPLVLLKLEKQV